MNSSSLVFWNFLRFASFMIVTVNPAASKSTATNGYMMVGEVYHQGNMKIGFEFVNFEGIFL